MPPRCRSRASLPSCSTARVNRSAIWLSRVSRSSSRLSSWLRCCWRRVCFETLTDLLPEFCASERLVGYHEVSGHWDYPLDLCSVSWNVLLAATACSSACQVAPPPCLLPGGVYPRVRRLAAAGSPGPPAVPPTRGRPRPAAPAGPPPPAPPHAAPHPPQR